MLNFFLFSFSLTSQTFLKSSVKVFTTVEGIITCNTYCHQNFTRRTCEGKGKTFKSKVQNLTRRSTGRKAKYHSLKVQIFPIAENKYWMQKYQPYGNSVNIQSILLTHIISVLFIYGFFQTWVNLLWKTENSKIVKKPNI